MVLPINLQYFIAGGIVGAFLILLLIGAFRALRWVGRQILRPRPLAVYDGERWHTRRHEMSKAVYHANARMQRIQDAHREGRGEANTVQMAEDVLERVRCLAWYRGHVLSESLRQIAVSGEALGIQGESRILLEEAAIADHAAGRETDQKFDEGIRLLELIEARSLHEAYRDLPNLGMLDQVLAYRGSTGAIVAIYEAFRASVLPK